MILLSKKEIEVEHRLPYILSGYRQTNISFLQCLQYTLVLHNDVINFWTHFLPFVVWLAWLFTLGSYYDLDPYQPYNYPLICMWIGSCCYALFSSIAHLLSSKSLLVHRICFMLDYFGIALYGLGLDLAGLFYLSSSSSPLFLHRNVVIALEVLLALTAIVVGVLSDVFWSDYCYVIRTFMSVIPYVAYISPFLHRQCVCWIYGTECIPETAHLHFLSILACVLAAFFYASKVPEKWMPGKFDTFFQSHQLFHVCCAVSTCLQMYFFPVEIKIRKKLLLQVNGAMPSVETTLLPFAFTVVFGLGVILSLAALTSKGALFTQNNEKCD